MQTTKIRWAKTSWNPVHGCSKVSPGCAHCYAETLSLRYGYSRLPWTDANAGVNVRLAPHKLNEPLKLRQPSRVFVNSMSDLFHPLVPDEYIEQVFAVMDRARQHQFLVLTKRPERAATWPGPWSENVWMGATVENRRFLARVDALRKVPAAVRFLSAEPLLGPLGPLGPLDLSGIHWVIIGGESGSHLKGPQDPRWMQMSWARELRDQCVAAKTACFFKQDSGARTETRPWIVETDGSAWRWEQFPDQPLSAQPPVRVI